MYIEKICQRLRANSVVSAWENQRLLRCEKWPRKKNLQADKMLEQSNKRFKPAEEGENVNVPIPEVDRGRLDPPNFTDVIQEHDFWDRTLHFGDKSWNSEHTVLKKPIQPDEPKVPDDSWRSWRRHTQCERSCSSPQQHGRTRIFQVPLPNCLSDKKMQMHQGLCQVQFSLS